MGGARLRLERLAALGVEADDVDVVVNSHIDGIGWNTRPSDDGWRPTFPNARYVFHDDEPAALDRGWTSTVADASDRSRKPDAS